MNKNVRRLNHRHRSGQASFFICVFSILIAIIGCVFGVYGMRLARNASIENIPDDDINIVEPAASDGPAATDEPAASDEPVATDEPFDYLHDYSWSIFHEVGLHYDILHPLDEACEESIRGMSVGRVQIVEAIWIYGTKWKEEMEMYHALLVEELDANGVIWEVGFEPIEVQRGDLGWMASNAQDLWEAFNTNSTDFDDFIRSQVNHGGTIMQNYRAGYRYDSYRTRALYLKSLYDFLTRFR
jgi:hypothetical protein